jgi:GTP-binding protein HflX
VLVYNKSDLLDDEGRRLVMTLHPEAQLISATEGTGIRGLLYRIAQEASHGEETCTVLIPFEKGILVKMVHERCQIIRERYTQEGLLATIRASARMRQMLESYLAPDETGDLEDL